MKTILFTFGATTILLSATAQKRDTLNKTDNINMVFTSSETPPQYPGGFKIFAKYLDTAIHYPQNAKKQRLQGIVYVQFIVEKDGSLSNITVARGVSPDLDKEALRVIANSARWTPGMQNGHVLRVYYSVPIRFKLAEDADE